MPNPSFLQKLPPRERRERARRCSLDWQERNIAEGKCRSCTEPLHKYLCKIPVAKSKAKSQGACNRGWYIRARWNLPPVQELLCCPLIRGDRLGISPFLCMVVFINDRFTDTLRNPWRTADRPGTAFLVGRSSKWKWSITGVLQPAVAKATR